MPNSSFAQNLTAGGTQFDFLEGGLTIRDGGLVLGTTSHAAATPTAGLLSFGGTTSSFPALKRASAVLEVRLADDSAYANIQVASALATTFCYAGNTSSVVAGGTNAYGFKLSSTASLGIFCGSGAPTLSAAQGSVYIRTDGSSVSTRLYVNTDGATTWTNVTTAA